jgi:putative membrane protein
MAVDLFGARIALSPWAGATAIGFIFAGIAVGTVSGLTPGLHVNALAMLLAIAAPSVPGPPHVVGATLLAAGVTHSFLDVIPSLTLGVPDAAMAATTLPGHRLVLGGRGREALRLSALGSASAVAVALVLGYPTTLVMTRLYPAVRANLPLVLALVVVALLAGERTWLARGGALIAVVASGALGVVVLDATPTGVLPVSDVLLPAFAGLFGVPILLAAATGGGVPEQADARLATRPRTVARAALAGSGAGGVVGYVPGVSAAIAAVLSLAAIPGTAGDRGFLVAVSGVNTSNTIFALFALVALGSPRTGVLVAYERASLPLNLPLLLAAITIAGAVSVVLVVTIGDRALQVAHRIDNRRLVGVVLALLLGLAVLFAGLQGVGVLMVASVVGFIPAATRSRRVHLMGVLLVPLATGL